MNNSTLQLIMAFLLFVSLDVMSDCLKCEPFGGGSIFNHDGSYCPSGTLQVGTCSQGVNQPPLGPSDFSYAYYYCTSQDHYAIPDGCTSPGGILDDLLNPGVSFRAACNQHDLCYFGFGKSKQTCDHEFRDAMRNECQWWNTYCDAVAESFYYAVKNHAGSHWDSSQETARNGELACTLAGQSVEYFGRAPGRSGVAPPPKLSVKYQDQFYPTSATFEYEIDRYSKNHKSGRNLEFTLESGGQVKATLSIPSNSLTGSFTINAGNIVPGASARGTLFDGVNSTTAEFFTREIMPDACKEACPSSLGQFQSQCQFTSSECNNKIW